MALISSDIAAVPFLHACLHAEAILASNVVPAPLLHRCLDSCRKPTSQPGAQMRGDVANQSASLTTVHVNFELAAVRGGITNVQP